MENIREKRQRELAQSWISNNMYGIINACPRFGKIFMSIIIMRQVNPNSILIAYPDNKIKKSWEDDFEKFSYHPSNIMFTTYLSLHKHVEEKYDLVILDEIHLMSEAQIESCKTLLEANRRILGLTGTLSSWTAKVLKDELSLPVVARYSIEMAIKEGILPDYEINVITTPLDDKILVNYGGKRKTEKTRFANYKWVVDKLEKEEKNSFHMKLKIISILQTSSSRMKATIDLIEKFKEERLLVFCGRTEVADNLGIPSFHSKSSEKQVWEDFVEGRIKHLAVVKIGNSGVTYTPLSKVIINYFDSNPETMTQRINRCMNMEYDNPEKKAVIYVISSTEPIELEWLKKSLAMFDKNKIKYL